MKRFLLIIRFADDSRPTDIQSRTAKIAKTVSNISNQEMKLAFTTKDGNSLGILFVADKPAELIYKELNGPEHKTALFLNDDHLLILEVGSDFYGNGFSNAWTWLQHHG